MRRTRADRRAEAARAQQLTEQTVIVPVKQFVQDLRDQINAQLALLSDEQAQEYLNSLSGTMFAQPYQE